MSTTDLKINVDKTELLCVGSNDILSFCRTRVEQVISEEMGLTSSHICSTVKLLGVQLNQTFNMEKRISALYKTSMFNIKTTKWLK